ncbi:Ubiquitin-conjugating enzyme E2 [Spironucleus salmonicida]|uniref:Ubiquitin-conjugating enzyme E2 n=1 Tax=Spironucleus salmonicida TaxID=348837 RepID=V6LJW1_9EUKA|nr:Ubiquitin-conjugating enzyme E2 [Spironucleus salmonicida]|eukprot:EST44011.1 Ubiquitin-conjugating enzyme E2 [Spironucleus salmonicida]
MINRLTNEYKQSLKKDHERLKLGIQLHPKIEGQLQSWNLLIKFNQRDSFYYNQQYTISMNIPKDYPLQSPYCHVKNKIFHPNISIQGEICLNILKEDWQISFNLFSVAISLLALINTPNTDSPLNLDAGNIFRSNDKLAYKSMVNYFYYE